MITWLPALLRIVGRIINGIKCQEDEDMSKKGYSRPGFFGSINHYDANGKK